MICNFEEKRNERTNLKTPKLCPKNGVHHTTNTPTVTTNSVTNPTQTTATCGGNVTSDGGLTVSARGVCWNTTGNPTISDPRTTDGTGTGPFTSNMTGLSTGTPYIVRAYATNASGTSYGDEVNFSTTGSGTLPTVLTTAISNTTQTSATGGGNVTNDGGSSVTAKGVCYNTTGIPVISDLHTSDGSGTGTFTSNITGLSASTHYYVRAYATNGSGTAYGDTVSFTTNGASSGMPCPGMATITDPRDGKIYPTVQIGTQCWLQKNMNYQIGNSWCYENNPANCSTYGRLYDWLTAMGVCPSGWHLPDDGEWTLLTTLLGGESIAGGTIKEAGTTHWAAPNTGATNISGFTALPGGERDYFGDFVYLTITAYFWSSLDVSSSNAWYRNLGFDSEAVSRGYTYKSFGFSVRCVHN
ncbi:MAG: fibrobacter succinogenes major paralogous domain-containing protein [Bacteroidetes bacterium]|nr:fibrobacter succinogenes major paralogous domain-containing protein [Bacteroidota bacterium]